MTEWQVAMLGPSRVGKTSLLTALGVAAQEYFAGTPIQVGPADDVTRRAFTSNENRMLGELAARRFAPDSLPGDTELHEYGLAIEPVGGAADFGMTLRFVDYPGDWIKERPTEVSQLLADSPAILVPIDATLIMEATSSHYSYAAQVLELSEVKLLVSQWAKARSAAGDPCQLILVPVKCETYFADNGGNEDRSELLQTLVRRFYGEVVDTYRKELSSDAPVLFAPVDTIGPIELRDVEWTPDEHGVLRFRPTYFVRMNMNGDPIRRQVKGVEPILATLVSEVVKIKRQSDEEARQTADEVLTKRQREGEAARSTWWKRVIDTFSLQKAKREELARKDRETVDILDQRLSKLAESVESISSRSREWSRVRPW